MTPIDAIPTPDLAVPYAAPILAKHNAAVTPMNPKNGADVGHVSYDTVDIFIRVYLYIIDSVRNIAVMTSVEEYQKYE
jgi:hypothetical protein